MIVGSFLTFTFTR